MAHINTRSQHPNRQFRRLPAARRQQHRRVDLDRETPVRRSCWAVHSAVG
jgi:hypothetical protein